MSDPDSVVREPAPPTQPPRPQQAHRSQLEADEQYARQLAEHYGQGASYVRPGSGNQGNQGYPRGQQARNMQSNYNEEERSFLDDDLPVIKENLRKGFLETQSKFNGWITQLKKKIDGDEEDDEPESSRYGAGAGTGAARRSYDGRRSGDIGRYDADPQVLGDDFAGIQLNDDGSKSDSCLGGQN